MAFYVVLPCLLLCVSITQCMEVGEVPLMEAPRSVRAFDLIREYLVIASNNDTSTESHASRHSDREERVTLFGTYAEAALSFESYLASQIASKQEFYAFVKKITEHYQVSWRTVIPLLEFIGRSFITVDGYIMPKDIYAKDFIEARKPYFLSHDEAGRPFIAFLFKQRRLGTNQAYGEAKIQVYYFQPSHETWLIEGGLDGEASIDSFTALAQLFINEEATAYSRHMPYKDLYEYALLSEDEMKACAEKQAAQKE